MTPEIRLGGRWDPIVEAIFILGFGWGAWLLLLDRADVFLVFVVPWTAFGLWLKLGHADGHPHPLIDHLNLRIQAWWVMTLTIGLALIAGRISNACCCCAEQFCQSVICITLTPSFFQSAAPELSWHQVT